MKCKNCGGELTQVIVDGAIWYDCNNCNTYWKFIDINKDGMLLQPYKSLPASEETIKAFKNYGQDRTY